MKKIVVWLMLGISIGVYAQNRKSDKEYQNKTIEYLQNKNFYLLSSLADDQEVKEVLREDKVLKSYLENHSPDRKSGLPKSAEEIITPFLFGEGEIEIIGKRLKELLHKNKIFTNLIQKLRDSHSYANFENYPDDEFLSKAWELCARGIDTILEVYGMGKKPLYSKIDSVSFDVRSRQYLYAISVLGEQLTQNSKEDMLFFEHSLDLSLSLLYANHRDEAVRYDPLEEKENAKAIEAIKSMNFSDYEYGCIVILGGGPENYRDRLSIMGKVNLQLAMKEYRSKKAPFIIVSGGHVHPNMTPYCEAIEMKRELVSKFGVPEEHVIIEPYARHTTTNMRNATRLMVSYGIPADKKSLVVTNPAHSSYLESDAYKERCQKELGYQPVNLQDRLSAFTLQFTGNIQSFHQNPYQPLDP
ncbi:YdcF family protein [Abyssalbus ytuae]|uniref:YdcF family protein n=1 Tax=Abyssalbus ytuae TaxID=2926907 RepID=A0A9E6ZSH2_9FLAO|nr:YdcF family protein [Abyssalbus ytuae]UOB17038.1 YdcF family protein [Abyssalbus ytuae]